VRQLAIEPSDPSPKSSTDSVQYLAP